MRVLRLLNQNFERVVGAACLGVVVTLIFIGVVMRVGFNTGIPWQEELSRILFVLMIYVGASYGAYRNEHIRVTMLRDCLPEIWRRRLDIVNDLLWIAFNIMVIWYAAKSLFGPMSRFVAHTAYLSLDLRIPFAGIPVLTALQTIRLAERFYQKNIRRNGREATP
ncbi:MAG: TRAP transporter small permease [Planctomycetes bacterium]|nr:TRAP transporter small permease [Planctomycetota bacterium]